MHSFAIVRARAKSAEGAARRADRFLISNGHDYTIAIAVRSFEAKIDKILAESPKMPPVPVGEFQDEDGNVGWLISGMQEVHDEGVEWLRRTSTEAKLLLQARRLRFAMLVAPLEHRAPPALLNAWRKEYLTSVKSFGDEAGFFEPKLRAFTRAHGAIHELLAEQLKEGLPVTPVSWGPFPFVHRPTFWSGAPLIDLGGNEGALFYVAMDVKN